MVEGNCYGGTLDTGTGIFTFLVDQAVGTGLSDSEPHHWHAHALSHISVLSPTPTWMLP